MTDTELEKLLKKNPAIRIIKSTSSSDINLKHPIPELASSEKKNIRIVLHTEPKRFDSEAERKVALHWLPLQEPKASGYQELVIKLPGGRYTPDFWFIDKFGIFCIVEVKGIIRGRDGKKIHHKSHRDSRAKFRAAKALWSWARFIWIEVKGDEFNVKT
jgi:hypothetical protein